jgi:hypothetical protein
VDDSAYIVGEKNSTVVAILQQPAVLRCAAGGYPKPHVTWWRRDLMLPLKDDRYEITREYSLRFSRVELHDLGPYICQAYNSFGRPVSMHVTLKARGPVRPRTIEDQKYMEYIVNEPEPTRRPFFTPPTTVRTTLRPRTRPPVREPTQTFSK